MPELSRPAKDMLVRITESCARGRGRQDTKAAAGRPGPDVTGLDDDRFASRTREFDGRDDTGDAGADDNGICGCG